MYLQLLLNHLIILLDRPRPLDFLLCCEVWTRGSLQVFRQGMVPCIWLKCSIRLDALFNFFRFSFYDGLDHLPYSFDFATCSSFALFEALVDRLQFIVWFLISFPNQSLHRFDCLHLLVWRVLEIVASDLYLDTLIHRHESFDFLLFRGIIPLLDWRLSSLLDTLCLWFGLSLVQYFQVMLGLIDRYFSVLRFC